MRQAHLPLCEGGKAYVALLDSKPARPIASDLHSSRLGGAGPVGRGGLPKNSKVAGGDFSVGVATPARAKGVLKPFLC